MIPTTLAAFAGTIALCLALTSCENNKPEQAQFKTRKDSLSYAIGLDIGRNLKRQTIDIDPAILARGVKEMYDSGKGSFTDSVSQSITSAFRKRAKARHAEEVRTEGDKNMKEGEAFLSENRKKDGVVVLPSGLQYKILRAGTGRKPKPGQTVVVNFRGTLLDGTEFDNTYTKGQPAAYTFNSLLKGWSEALQLMPAGSKWTLYLPAALAFGERGAGQLIPPGATLVFEIELLQVK